jgi:excisionase family DNA binding protein
VTHHDHLLVALLDDHEIVALRQALALLARRCRDDGHKMPAALAAIVAMTEQDNTGPARPAVDHGHVSGDAGPVTPLAVDYEDAARMVGVSSRQVRRLVASGALPVVHVGGAGSPRIRVLDLHTYLAAQVEGHRPGGVAS